MYRWYAEANKCYAFLSDVQGSASQALERSVYFTRGWTLQEMIAPKKLSFYDCDWALIGTRSSLSTRLSAITKVDVSLLKGDTNVYDYSVAERMSWAASRVTKREEDRAYSLLGLFAVSMPMLYGEGDRAFLRLQEEIMKVTDDETLFAWPLDTDNKGSLLASSPACFADCSGLEVTQDSRATANGFGLSNGSLSITLRLTPWRIDTYLAPLNCQYPHQQLRKQHGKPMVRTGILLRRTERNDEYVRVDVKREGRSEQVYSLLDIDTDLEKYLQKVPYEQRVVKVRQAGLSPMTRPSCPPVSGFRLGPGLLRHDSRGRRSIGVHNIQRPYQRWYPDDGVMKLLPGYSFDPARWVLDLDLSARGKRIKKIRVAFDFDFNPVIFLAESAALERLSTDSLPEYQKPPNVSDPYWQYFTQQLFSKGTSGPSSSDIQNAQRAIDLQKRERSWIAQQNSRLNLDYEWKLKSFEERKLLDGSPDEIWNEVSGNIAKANKARPGLWQLKGSRTHGLNLVLEGSSNTRSQRNSDTTLVLQKTPIHDGLIWDLDIINLAS